MLAIVDYGVGNLFSLECSLAAIGVESVVTADPAVLEKADQIILPGVGAFGEAAEKLRKTGLDKQVGIGVIRSRGFINQHQMFSLKIPEESGGRIYG